MNTFKNSIFFILVFAALTVKGQNVLSLAKVTFYSPVAGTKGWIRLEKDQDTGDVISGVSQTDAWEVGSTMIKDRPVAYVSGTQPRVSAVFKKIGGFPLFGCNRASASLFVRGRWADAPSTATPLLKPKELSPSMEYNIEPFSFVFDKYTIRYYPAFTIIWEYATSEEGPWKPISSSFNPLYVTHSAPVLVGTSFIQSLPGETHFLTSVHIACKEANGQSSIVPAANQIYNLFKGRCVGKVNGTKNCMEYWGAYSNGGTSFDTSRTLRHFLAQEDARCGEWQQFLSDVFSKHGIYDGISSDYGGKPVTVTAYNTVEVSTPEGSYFTGTLPPTAYSKMINTISSYFPGLFDPSKPFDRSNRVYLPDGLLDGRVESYFFVKEWAFSQEDDLYGMWPINEIRQLNGHFISGADKYGARAQGNSDPTSFFNNHAILKYNNLYYDPSYGTGPFSSNSTWSNASIAGFGIRLFYRDIDGIEHPLLWLHETISTNNHVKFN